MFIIQLIIITIGGFIGGALSVGIYFIYGSIINFIRDKYFRDDKIGNMWEHYDRRIFWGGFFILLFIGIPFIGVGASFLHYLIFGIGL